MNSSDEEYSQSSGTDEHENKITSVISTLTNISTKIDNVPNELHNVLKYTWGASILTLCGFLVSKMMKGHDSESSSISSSVPTTSHHTSSSPDNISNQIQKQKDLNLRQTDFYRIQKINVPQATNIIHFQSILRVLADISVFKTIKTHKYTSSQSLLNERLSIQQKQEFEAQNELTRQLNEIFTSIVIECDGLCYVYQQIQNKKIIPSANVYVKCLGNMNRCMLSCKKMIEIWSSICPPSTSQTSDNMNRRDVVVEDNNDDNIMMMLHKNLNNQNNNNKTIENASNQQIRQMISSHEKSLPNHIRKSEENYLFNNWSSFVDPNVEIGQQKEIIRNRTKNRTYADFISDEVLHLQYMMTRIYNLIIHWCFPEKKDFKQYQYQPIIFSR
jgi:hypothetical protein